MSNFLSVFKHLLPNGRAWRATSAKSLRALLEGLAGGPQDARDFIDNTFLDVRPQNTRELSAWESQFALPSARVTDAVRRKRLAAAWSAIGGQDPAYIQRTLRDAGFDVYVHEWWEPGTEPPVGVKGRATPRNPLLHIRGDYTALTLGVECGEPGALCGEPWAMCGNQRSPVGYPLVNKIYLSVPYEPYSCGERDAFCGEPKSGAGIVRGVTQFTRNYTVSPDPGTHANFLYIGGADFGTMATVSSVRRDEFEDLLLKIKPLQLWLAVIVEYN